MTARLKSFELHGYKTFAIRTEFVFADGITAIVGPNGSGKSNIADALRWVLGEQSYGLLRGKRTEDMIFSGSEQRSRAGMAQATVVFDNSDGWLPIDFSEVAITRRAYRDGDNEYLLNGQRVRLRDVSELLSKSGLSERTYTVIGQGLVDAALALKAEERRRLFEEAAGIGLYRSRREEALRRLESTRRNLERVQDILSELQPRLRSLERQAKRAQEYEQVRVDLMEVLREWYGYHWHRAQAELMEAQTLARKQEEALDLAQKVQANQDNKLMELRQKLQNFRVELSYKYKKLAELHQHQEGVNRKTAVYMERIRLLTIQKDEINAEFYRQQESIVLLEERKKIAESELEQLTVDLQENKTRLNQAELELDQLEKQRNSLELLTKEANDLLSDTAGKQAFLIARLEEKHAYRGRQAKALETELSTIERIEAEIRASNENDQTLDALLDKANQRLVEIESKHKEIRAEYDDAERHSKQTQEEKRNIEAKVVRLTSELEVLEQAENSLAGYADGAKLLLRSMKAGDVIGAIGGRLLVPSTYENAISSALGEYIDAIVYRDSGKVDDSLDLLRAKTTRGAIFPLDALVVKKAISIDSVKSLGDQNDILGVASELIQYPVEYREVVDLLLGHVIVVKDRNVARNMLASASWKILPDLRIVTLEGELFSANGIVVAGPTKSTLIGRPRKLVEHKEAVKNQDMYLKDADESCKRAASNVISASNRVNESSKELENAQQAVADLSQKKKIEQLARENIQKNLTWHIEQKTKINNEIKKDQDEETVITEELEKIELSKKAAQEDLRKLFRAIDEINIVEARSQFTFWRTRVAVAEQATNDAARRVDDINTNILQMRNGLKNTRNRIDSATTELTNLDQEYSNTIEDEQLLIAELSLLQSEIEPLEAETAACENEHNDLLAKDSDARQRFRNSEHYHAQAKILLARRQEALDSLRRRIEDDFGLVSFDYADSITGPKPLPLDGMVQTLPFVKELSPETEISIQRQKSQLKRMGPINMEAQSEYIEVRDRYNFMVEQVTDLQKAENDIQEVIAELDHLMQREFRRTFDAVAQEFKEIFSRLFNGGMARLVLTEPEDIAITGIDIEARLPGRREQGLSLLSGGERSLTAVALVFALLRISPTPFCILDEVDAMLDEANVSRFREMLIELSENTQFIIITHNRSTVQAAGVIYGVTMGRDSSSQVISLNLEELSEDYGV